MVTDYINKFRLDNKIAFIIGGLGLIGSEISKALASAGAIVVILDIELDKGKELEKEIRDKGYEIYFKNFDSSQINNLDTNFYELILEYGSPDIFINCSYPRTPDWGKSSFKEITLNSFRKNVDIHMNSYAWLARLSAEAMKDSQKDGSIIQLGSIYGILGRDMTIYEGTDMHENMTYSAIKGGITNLTRQMASYYGKFNIRVNTLCPGGINGHVAGKGKKQDQVFVKQYSNKTPLKRLGKAEEVASTALFLASEAASYITGATIMVDGGWTAI